MRYMKHPRGEYRKKNRQNLLRRSWDTDVRYIQRIVGLVLRQGGLESETDPEVYNVYDPKRPLISSAILDKHTKEVGEYLIKKYIASASIFGCTSSDKPDIKDVDGPRPLLQKLKSSKGITLKRMSARVKETAKTDRELREEKRQVFVKREAKRIDCMSSAMNACQALVKPDCSKPKVGKSVGMKKAIQDILLKALQKAEPNTNSHSILQERNLIYSSVKMLPKDVTDYVTVAAIEFAGVKFKTKSTSGSQYLKHVDRGVIMKTKVQFPRVRQLAVCEEKYSYTPDDFKAATRSQRQQKKKFSITHLKTAEEMLTAEKFDKQSLVETNEGKHLVSTYLARHVDKLSIPATLTVDIDSEFVKSKCNCKNQNCTCDMCTYPIRVEFPTNKEYKILRHIQQRKGEAEFAQIDWLIEYSTVVNEGEACASIVTSGDIDSVILHLFALAYLWPRSSATHKFVHEVYVILEKPGSTYDIYNVTAILTVLEDAWKDPFIGLKLSIALSIGGNDYMPKFHGISHQETLHTFFNNDLFYNELLKINISSDDELKISLNEDIYLEFVKFLYTNKGLNSKDFSYNEIRQLSIKPPTQKSPRNPQLWLPPASAIRNLSKNVRCLISYYMTAGRHSAETPDFLQEGCLIKMSNGDIEFDFGEEVHVDDISICLEFSEEILSEKISRARLKSVKRKQENTPQKGRRRKMKPKTSTPRKSEST